IEDVMISGPGLIDGSDTNAAGEVVGVLTGDDPREASIRTDAGEPGAANKAIAIVNARNITFRDFSIKNGGHFGILGTGIVGWTIDGIIVDTNRDALDIDASQNVTVRNSVFNSLTDDAIVLKASFGLGRFLPTHNVLIENCTVSGYDAGSVIDKVYSTEKLVATDRDGPTARIKLGTEGTTGFDTVTIRHVRFERSRGFALESVDGADLHDIILSDARMTNVSSSPIFIRLGDRGRTPVTGPSVSEVTTPTTSIRLDDRGWVLPNLPARYGNYPVVRFTPAYDKSMAVPLGGASTPFTIVNAASPVRLNPNGVDPASPMAANAVGAGFAHVRNIRISDVIVDNADPRYPILLAGLVDHPIENVTLTDVTVRYRGGLLMEHAVEQRQLNQQYSYRAYQSPMATQSLPWLVNTFFAKNEALLPRVRWTAGAAGGEGHWDADPYNVPEMPREYPEPSNFGILLAYGLYARHVQGLTLENVSFHLLTADERPPVVLDDVDTLRAVGFTADVKPGAATVVRVTNSRKRIAGREYVPGEPYKTTTVRNVSVPAALVVQEVVVDRPAPGTPPDSLYLLPTAPSTAHPYSYAVPDASYTKPPTVYRPSFSGVGAPRVTVGQALDLVVRVTSPLGLERLRYSAQQLPTGATFDAATHTLHWMPTPMQVGTHTIRLTVDDGVLPEHCDVVITVVR
ncbi:MAG: right-handed parallel beta-helix repeat-containing protein, partial [Vicinamibacterales bacterium]